ncbi:MAG: methyltransferase [Candidatus Obscuribacterales bacterium]|nr:methyltransferase [Candidatus Obscuribacterales bacterium]
MNSRIQSFKTKVERAFSRHAQSYDQHAGLQTLAAESCSEFLQSLGPGIPEGDFLEIGSGTGIFSSMLLKAFPERNITFSDLSAQMLNACRMRLAKQITQKHSFEIFDAEESKLNKSFAAISSSFAIQWFYQPLEGIKHLVSALKSDGVLVITFPGEQSCPQWREAAEKLDIPFTFNPMPKCSDMAEMAEELGIEFQYKEEIIDEQFDGALSMFRSIKELGAGTQKHELRLSVKQLRRLMTELENSAGSAGVKCSYQLITAVFRKVNT